MAQRFNADDSDHSGSTRACACGRTARYAGRRPKTFITLLGPLTLERAYYHCDTCRTGVCPRDQTLGMQATSLSPATTRMVGLTAAEVSFAKTYSFSGVALLSDWETTILYLYNFSQYGITRVCPTSALEIAVRNGSHARRRKSGAESGRGARATARACDTRTNACNAATNACGVRTTA